MQGRTIRAIMHSCDYYAATSRTLIGLDGYNGTPVPGRLTINGTAFIPARLRQFCRTDSQNIASGRLQDPLGNAAEQRAGYDILTLQADCKQIGLAVA